MPHVRRSMLITVDAAPDRVGHALVDVLCLAPRADAYAGPIVGMPDTTATLTATLQPASAAADRTELRLDAESTIRVPFFTWFLRLQARLGARRALPYAADRLRAALAGTAPPEPPKPLPVVPPVPFTPEQAARLCALSAAALLANFCGGLLSQNADAVTSAFGRSDQALGVALAVARAGVLVSLVAIALADRLGRRRLILATLVGACAANLVAAAAPSFEVFTGAQLFTRALVNSALIVAGIAAVEDAPEGARAFATGMYALALGAGIGLTVVLLPLADLGDYGWRISFALSAATVLLVPVIARHLKETTRYVDIVDRPPRQRGRVREVLDHLYGARFLLLGLAAFLTNLFSAPSSQLTNRYLTHAHAFSNSDVALFRFVTAGVPGIVGVLLASRLAESRGRRPVAVVGLLVATGFQVAFFLAGATWILWLAPTIAIVAAACAALSLGTLDAELFPTEVRGTSNGFLLVSAVAGSAVGLVLATQLKDLVGGLGPGIAICGTASLLAAILVVPRLPETAELMLDDVSPSELP
jgi:MFS family permease